MSQILERALNGTWADPRAWEFYADDGFGNLIRVSNWPAMNCASAAGAMLDDSDEEVAL